MEEISTAKDDKIEEEHGGEHGLVADLDEAGTGGSLLEDPSARRVFPMNISCISL
jgi:hypothetical protein